ncbi:hypothetical protein KDM41_06605 [bacterium]|nr:hypothetical protein [bacterium]
MRDRREPWKWPLCVALAVLLLGVGAFGIPRAWLAFLLPAARPEAARDGAATRWLALLPPPEIEIVAPPPRALEPLPPPPELPPADPRWWTRGFAVAARDDPGLFAPAVADTIDLVLAALGLDRGLLAATRPDSVLAARLQLLRIHDAFRYDELKPMLLHMGRAEAYADILARAADMYDEPLAQEIRVPD